MKDEGLREKVIKGLECCILRDPDDHARCSQCPYESSCANCVNRLKMDALELLKEQEPVRPVLARIGNYAAINDYTCPECGTDLYHLQKYCDECGRPVKWDE